MNPEPKGFVQTPNNARLSDLLPNSAQATLTLTGCSAYKVMGSWCLLSQRQITAFHIHSLPLDSPRQERVQPLSHQRPAPPRILNIPYRLPFPRLSKKTMEVICYSQERQRGTPPQCRPLFAAYPLPLSSPTRYGMAWSGPGWRPRCHVPGTMRAG